MERHTVCEISRLLSLPHCCTCQCPLIAHPRQSKPYVHHVWVQFHYVVSLSFQSPLHKCKSQQNRTSTYRIKLVFWMYTNCRWQELLFHFQNGPEIILLPAANWFQLYHLRVLVVYKMNCSKCDQVRNSMGFQLYSFVLKVDFGVFWVLLEVYIRV